MRGTGRGRLSGGLFLRGDIFMQENARREHLLVCRSGGVRKGYATPTHTEETTPPHPLTRGAQPSLESTRIALCSTGERMVLDQKTIG